VLIKTLEPGALRDPHRDVQPSSTPDANADIDGPALVAAYLPTIQQAVRVVRRQSRITHQEAEELLSIVVVRLLQRNAAVLRQFRGDCSIRTFLAMVVRRILVDGWISQNGKWRTSAAARRLGPVAVALERLVHRDHLPFHDAAETIRTRLEVSDTDDELAFLLCLLPSRPVRRFVASDALHEVPATAPTPLDRLMETDPASRQDRLARALGTLAPDDRRLVTLRFQKELTVATIARREGLDQGRLYRRFNKIFEHLRTKMECEATGVSRVSEASCRRRSA
jgi:RNA polymerase sigma factor for flagellar operon FliA